MSELPSAKEQIAEKLREKREAHDIKWAISRLREGCRVSRRPPFGGRPNNFLMLVPNGANLLCVWWTSLAVSSAERGFTIQEVEDRNWELFETLEQEAKENE